MLAPDALHRTDTDAGFLGHRSGGPVRRLARRIVQRAGDHTRLHRRFQRRDARRTGLVAQQAGDPIGHVAFLPAPHCRLAGGGTPHDLCCAAAIRRQQHDLCSPDMLLPAVPIRHDRRELLAIRGSYLDYDPGAHASDPHPKPSTGILNRTQPSDFIQ